MREPNSPKKPKITQFKEIGFLNVWEGVPKLPGREGVPKLSVRDGEPLRFGKGILPEFTEGNQP